MELNWSPEVIIDLIIATILLVIVILTYIMPKTKKITSLFYIRLTMFSFSLYFLFEAISFLFMSIFLHRIHTILIFPAAIFMLIGINYTMKESFMSITLIPTFSLGIFLFYLAFQPDAIKPAIEHGYPTIVWTGLLAIIAILIELILLIAGFYWGLKTWINAPFLIKKEAFLFFIGICISIVLSGTLYIFSFWIPILKYLADIFLIFGFIIIIISILREPKILYILPFTIYRIIVKDREGFPLYDHDWSKSEISETIFSGFINAIQLMSEDIMNIGGVVDIQLEEGILILQHSDLITVGLVASKSSKLLRECTQKFSIDFQLKFEKELKKSIRDQSKYESAYELIEKYFSNFPYRIITSRKQPLLLSGKFAIIPLEIDNKLKSIFKDESEYEFIKSELIKSPLCVPSDFLNLYNEVREEMDYISREDSKYLETKSTDDE